MVSHTAIPLEGSPVLDVAAEQEPDPRDTALVREAWDTYGDDIERELADLEAGRHPYQRAR